MRSLAVSVTRSTVLRRLTSRIDRTCRSYDTYDTYDSSRWTFESLCVGCGCERVQIPVCGASQALLAVLLLRGAQTLGELRIRTERMHAFPTVEAVEAELVDAAEDCEWLLWRRLPQAAGQKEARFMHLFFGGDASPADSVGEGVAVVPHAAVAAVQERNERISQLEDRVTQLEAQLGDLQYAFREFCRQFDPE